jgi:hypothetical protein
MKKNIITIAVGKQLYIDMAVSLTYSFLLWHENSEIDFYICTDQPQLIPDLVIEKINIIKLKEKELGTGFSSKLHLDKLAPEGQTIFIDSDCLIYGNLIPVFEKFKGHSVSVIGKYVSKGEWFGNIERVCQKYQVPHFPKFNGGVYYLENGEKAKSVYELARTLEKKYDEIGFIRLRNKPNDEVVMALAMQLSNCSPIIEDGSIMGEFVNFQSGFKSNLFKGKAILLNTPTHPKYQTSWELTEGKPLIVHFLGNHTLFYPYIVYQKQLALFFGKNPMLLIKLNTFISITFPWFAHQFFKNLFRPMYRVLFGFRKRKKSERVID